jgi:hypothetical protein
VLAAVGDRYGRALTRADAELELHRRSVDPPALLLLRRVRVRTSGYHKWTSSFVAGEPAMAPHLLHFTAACSTVVAIATSPLGMELVVCWVSLEVWVMSCQ